MSPLYFKAKLELVQKYKLSGVVMSVKSWVKDNLLEITLFFIISGICTPLYFYLDNEKSRVARQDGNFRKCQKISTQFIKKRCFKRILDDKISKCPDYALNGNVENCIRDMKARMKGFKPKEKFPLKLSLYFLIEILLGGYFFYFKEKWSRIK
ncbi:MAG: hypothetical protein ACJAT2_002112 [Bacteriovoracaceae bacterium]